MSTRRTTQITATTATKLNQTRTMAPSQKAKMILIEGVASQIITCTARVDFTKNGVAIKAGEKFLLVASQNFAGWYYVVSWTAAGIDACSCGKPYGCVHKSMACAYTKTYHAPKPAIVPPVSREVEVDITTLTQEEIRERIREGTRKQKELSLAVRREYQAKLATLKQGAA